MEMNEDEKNLRAHLTAYGWGSFKILPLIKGDKRPAVSGWAADYFEYDPIEIVEKGLGVGIITGKHSNITVIDIDVIDANGTPGTDPRIFPPTYTVRTPSGGYHKYYLYDERITQTQSSFKAFPKLDIRNDGGYVVAPPTFVTYEKKFDDGTSKVISGQYTVETEGDMLTDGIHKIAPFPTGLFLPFYNVIPTEDQAKMDEAVRTRIVDPSRPGDDFEATITWEQILSPLGFVKDGTDPEGGTRWTRPGKKSGTSATVRTGPDGRERLFVFSTNTGHFDPYSKSLRNSYNKISAYAHLHHNDDFAQAIRALRAMGYGVSKEQEVAGYEVVAVPADDVPSTLVPPAPEPAPEPVPEPQPVEVAPEPAKPTDPHEVSVFPKEEPENTPVLRHKKRLAVSASDFEMLQKLPEDTSLVSMRCLSDIEDEPIDWLWRGKVAHGELCIISGEPGTGKTMASIDLAARITTGGPVPFGKPGELMNNGQPGDVLFLTSENDPAKVLKPRLIAAGADLSRCHLIESSVTKKMKGGKLIKKHIALSEDSHKLGEACDSLPEGHIPVVLFIDPISEYMGAKDQNNNSDVRDLLATLTEHLRWRDIAIIAVSHLNKKTDMGSATARINGSVGFAGAARTVFTVTKYENPDWTDEEKEEYRGTMAFVNAKNNLSGDKGGCTYRIKGIQYENAKKQVIETAKIEWFEEIEESADEMLANSHRSGGNQTKDDRERCAEWLERFLMEHPEGVKRNEVINAALHEGYTSNTVNKAVGGLIVSKEGGVWKLIKPFKDATF